MSTIASYSPLNGFKGPPKGNGPIIYGYQLVTWQMACNLTSVLV